ncbi:MAG: hypothetical protein JXR96_21295 [Deltaproteobacteria bacterium]|nr:hypothetical protein [Deltaproteobacteria bacterium]
MLIQTALVIVLCALVSVSTGCGSAHGGCPEGWTRCDGICTDTRSDSQHCGACFAACEAGESCLEGRCQPAGCEDECGSKGEQVCAGERSYRVCSDDWDADSCLEWGPVNDCGPEQTCQEGSCAGEPPVCQDECELGQRRCAAAPLDGVEICGLFDGDPCLEWGGYAPCEHGPCEAGACPEACTDACGPAGARICDGDGVRICGDRDGDSCLEWSEVEACGRHEDCEDGECCIEEGEDCEDYDECCDCYHCCPVLHECVVDWWDGDCL